MIANHRTQRSRKRNERSGATVVEMAFVIPVLLVLLIGIIDFAMVIYAYGTVSEAARCGARYAMVHGSVSSSPVGPTADNTTVRDVVRTNALALDTSRLTVTSSWANTRNDVGSNVTVTATYDCPIIIGQLIGTGGINVSGTTTMTITH